MHTTTITTTWGVSPSRYESDPRSMRRYNVLLTRLANAGEVLVFVLLLGAGVGVAKVLFWTNFEHDIITDGTTRACLYDGDTGLIRHVD